MNPLHYKSTSVSYDMDDPSLIEPTSFSEKGVFIK